MSAVAAPPTLKLTEMQIGILARGMSAKEFQLMGGEAGKSSGHLVARGLIKQIRKGVYTITDWGRDAYQNVIDGHIRALGREEIQMDAASGLNLNDEALQETEAARWQRIADERMKTLRNAERTIDEQGRLLDDANAEIKRLETIIDQRDTKIEAMRRGMDRIAAVLKEMRG